MFLWAQMAADSSAIQPCAVVSEDSFSLDTCGLWWNVSQQGLVPTVGSCNAVYCCHLQAINWPQQSCCCSGLLKSRWNTRRRGSLYGNMECFVYVMGAGKAPQWNAAQRPVCHCRVVRLFLQASVIKWGNMFYIYISFFWGRKLRLDVIGSVRLAPHCVTLGQLHIGTPRPFIHVETMQRAVPNWFFGCRSCASEGFQHHGELTERPHVYMPVCLKSVSYFTIWLLDFKMTWFLFFITL